jgi:hypothetical protein
MISPIVFAIPIFALLITLEAWYDTRQNTGEYERRDAWTNIALGLAVSFSDLFSVFLFNLSCINYSIPSRLTRCR